MNEEIFTQDHFTEDRETIRRKLIAYLKGYAGRPLRFMEVCGTHTAQIAKNGIPSLLSDRIHLMAGPGCPVCVTVTEYVDRLIALSMEENTTVVSFGDLFRVPGSMCSLSEAKAAGGTTAMVYSPMDILPMARREKKRRFVFAAVGFETTAPVYAMLMKQVKREKLNNVFLLTSLKTMPPVIHWLGHMQKGRIDGFLAPGHVCAVTGTKEYEKLARIYGVPFVVSGFGGMELLSAIAGLVKWQGKGVLKNFYPSVVRRQGNETAWKAVTEVFAPCDAAWRGMGIIPGSGLCLSGEYQVYDVGSSGLTEDHAKNKACACGAVLTGEKEPTQCPLFGRGCSPRNPQGACMVSMEGSCFHAFQQGAGGREIL